LSLGTACLFGLLPAIRSSRINLQASLHGDTRKTAHAPTSMARTMLVAANVAMAVAAGGFALTSHVGALAVALRGLQGAAWAVGFSTAMALVSELAPADRLAQAIGFSGAASLAMNALAPAIGEPLAARFGHRPVFLLGTLASLVGVVLVRRLSLPAGVAASRGPSAPAGVAGAAGLDGRGPLLVVFGQAGLAFGVLFTFLAPFALQHRVTAVRPFFMAYTLAALAVRVVGSRLADGVGHRKVAALALALYGAVVAATGFVGPTWLLAIGVSFGVAHGAVFPAAMALLLEGTAPGRRTRLIGLANGAMSLGQVAVFPAGVLAERAGYPVVFIAAGAATMASATLLLRRR